MFVLSNYKSLVHLMGLLKILVLINLFPGVPKISYLKNNIVREIR